VRIAAIDKSFGLVEVGQRALEGKFSKGVGTPLHGTLFSSPKGHESKRTTESRPVVYMYDVRSVSVITKPFLTSEAKLFKLKFLLS
jgi:hypothetical protein